MVTVAQILAFEYWNNTGQDYIIAFGIFVVAFVAMKLFESYIIRSLKQLAKKSKTALDDILLESLDTIRPPFYTFIALFIAAQFLTLTDFVNKGLFFILIIAIVYYSVGFVQRIIDHFTNKEIERRLKEDDVAQTSMIRTLGKIAKAVLWVIAVLVVLGNIGVNITPLVAGLGVGGIAIAFALQNILEDLFSSFSIHFDKPFKEGDFIIIGSDMGTVKQIGIKTTRLITLQGQELIISNRELTSSRINNYKRMEKRRIVFGFGVEYSTAQKKMKKIPGIVAKIFDKIDNADLDRVHFKNFGDFSLNYEVVFYVKTSDYTKYMDIQQEINLTLKEMFEKEKIEFAFPTQSIILKK